MPGPTGTFPDPRSHWDRAPPPRQCLTVSLGVGVGTRFYSGSPPFLEGSDILLSHVLSAAFLAEGMNGLGPHTLDYNVRQRSLP